MVMTTLTIYCKTNDIEVYEASKILTMKLDIALLSGDGIGPEVTEQAAKAKAIAAEFDHTAYFTRHQWELLLLMKQVIHCLNKL